MRLSITTSMRRSPRKKHHKNKSTSKSTSVISKPISKKLKKGSVLLPQLVPKKDESGEEYLQILRARTMVGFRLEVFIHRI